MAHHNSIILKSISEYIFTAPRVFTYTVYIDPKTNGLEKKAVLSTAQPGAVLTCCRQIFSSSIPVYLSTKMNKERESFTTESIGGDYFRSEDLCFQNDKSYQDVTTHSFLGRCGRDATDFKLATDAARVLTYFLLAYCPTVRRFSPSLTVGRGTISYASPFSRNRDLGLIANGTGELNTFIHSTVGQYLKTLIVEDSASSSQALRIGFRKLFTQEYSRHPVPLLENITFINCDDSILLALSGASSKTFFPAPSLKSITFLYNDDQEPINSGNASNAMVSVIQTYAEHPTTRNNLQEIVFFHSDIDDAYDILGVADSMSVIVACAKYLPHCIRTVVVGLDDRFEYERDSQHIECFSKFEVLNKLVINSTRTGLEDDDENNLWSDDENELILPRTLTELELSFPVIDPRCLQQACKSQESFPYLHSFRHRHTLSNDTQILSDIFSSFATTLKTLQIECCWSDSCTNAAWNNDRTRYDKLTQVCFDPSKKSSFLCNLENFHLGSWCGCISKFNLHGKLFPLPPSIRRFHFKGLLHGSMLSHILFGDIICNNFDGGTNNDAGINNDNDNDNDVKQGDLNLTAYSSTPLPFLEEFCTQFYWKGKPETVVGPDCLEGFFGQLVDIAAKNPILLTALKRISINIEGNNYTSTFKNFELGAVMLGRLDSLHLFPLIEAFQITGHVKSIFACELNEVQIKTAEDLNEYLKTKKGNLESKLKHLLLGTEMKEK